MERVRSIKRNGRETNEYENEEVSVQTRWRLLTQSIALHMRINSSSTELTSSHCSLFFFTQWYWTEAHSESKFDRGQISPVTRRASVLIPLLQRKIYHRLWRSPAGGLIDISYLYLQMKTGGMSHSSNFHPNWSTAAYTNMGYIYYIHLQSSH